MKYYVKLLTYFGPLLLPEHRPPITTLQSPLSWAILSRCFHACPVLLMSFSSSRRQVFRGLPLFLWPWGFQLKLPSIYFFLETRRFPIDNWKGYHRICPSPLRCQIWSSSGKKKMSLTTWVKRVQVRLSTSFVPGLSTIWKGLWENLTIFQTFLLFFGLFCLLFVVCFCFVLYCCLFCFGLLFVLFF